jgi:phage tail sheath gpL-like
MIPMQFIPQALRYPGVYIEIDPSQANLGTALPAVLLVGQKLAAGSAAAGTLTQISGVADAVAKFGAGSMLAQMVARYRAIDPTFDLWALPYADNGAGTAASSALVVSNAPTAAGTLALYIAGRVVSVGVTAGQTTAQVAAAIAAAVTAAADMPVTAGVVGSTVTLTALHKGTCGNNLDVRLNLYGEATPAGLGVTLAAFAGGAGDPAPGNLAAMIGPKWFRYVHWV